MESNGSTIRCSLSLWVIYNKPKDHPDGLIARRWDMDRPTEETIAGKSLEELRERFESMGMVNIGRRPEDDPVIQEVWI